MAADSVRIVSLPGDRASSDRVVSTPYTTAAAAHTTATRAPWSGRNSDKETSLESRSSRTHAGGGPYIHAGKQAAAAVRGRRQRRVSVGRGSGGTVRAPSSPGTHHR